MSKILTKISCVEAHCRIGEGGKVAPPPPPPLLCGWPMQFTKLNIVDVCCFLNIRFCIDTLGTLARTVGEETFRPLARDCVAAGKVSGRHQYSFVCKRLPWR